MKTRTHLQRCQYCYLCEIWNGVTFSLKVLYLAFIDYLKNHIRVVTCIVQYQILLLLISGLVLLAHEYCVTKYDSAGTALFQQIAGKKCSLDIMWNPCCGEVVKVENSNGFFLKFFSSHLLMMILTKKRK